MLRASVIKGEDMIVLLLFWLIVPLYAHSAEKVLMPGSPRGRGRVEELKRIRENVMGQSQGAYLTQVKSEFLKLVYPLAQPNQLPVLNLKQISDVIKYVDVNAPDQIGNTALITAASLPAETPDKLEEIKLLVENGALINVCNSSFLTPVIQALLIGDIKVADFLMRNYGQACQRDTSNNTILHMLFTRYPTTTQTYMDHKYKTPEEREVAYLSKLPDLIEFIVEQGRIDINDNINDDGETPLFKAYAIFNRQIENDKIAQGQLEVFKKLTSKGANWLIRNEKGETVEKLITEKMTKKDGNKARNEALLFLNIESERFKSSMKENIEKYDKLKNDITPYPSSTPLSMAVKSTNRTEFCRVPFRKTLTRKGSLFGGILPRKESSEKK